jgi:glycosyltransferase involved in cell wall biosynthesis
MLPIILDARTVTDHFPGIGRYVVNLAGALKTAAPEFDLVLLRDPSAAAQRLILPDLPAIDCAVSPFALSQQWRVRSTLQSAHAALYHSPYYLMPYRPGAPVVFTCHDLIPLIFPLYYTARQRLVYRLTHQLALSIARMTIAVSQSTRNDLLRIFHVKPERIVVVPEGAAQNLHPPSRAEIDRVRAKYALPDRYVLYFGSNKPHKNLVRLIEAFARIVSHKSLADIHLVIGGQWDVRYGEARQRVALHNLSGRVKFIGPVSDHDLPALYGGTEVFVFPSEYEGFGLPVLEAMACGAPVVCGNRSSLPEVAGDAAVLCDPQDVSAIAQALEQVLTDQPLQQTLRARSLTRTVHFTWENTAVQTAALYRSLLL